MSTVKVNTVDKRTGGTLTLGGCGTTVTLGAGATQSGFGRTGTVDWCTTAKTAPFTGVSGNGYFVNTTSGVVTVTLPATPSAGDIISIADYASTWQTNAVTICRNSSKINGICNNASLSTEGQSITLVYVDATRGWKNTMDSTSNVTGAAYITATGGTVLTCGDFKTHIFTADGCFAVTSAGNPAGSTTIDYFVIAGGGSSGGDNGGGGGAGGFRISNSYSIPAPTMSPLASPTGLTAAIQTYPITVGAGGASGGTNTSASGPPGSNSVFSTIISAGGGAAAGDPTGGAAGSGGSGGGGFYAIVSGGAGNTPPVSPPQGNPGGTSTPSPGGGGGGGGAGAAAANVNPGDPGSAGGIGSFIADSVFGPTAPSYGEGGPVSSTRYFAGGGGGGKQPGPTSGNQGVGGIGGGGDAFLSSPYTGQNGVVNTGGGAGGGNPGTGPLNPAASTSGVGGSGIVMIRYKFQ
jgi:hypothetical protein